MFLKIHKRHLYTNCFFTVVGHFCRASGTKLECVFDRQRFLVLNCLKLVLPPTITTKLGDPGSSSYDSL